MALGPGQVLQIGRTEWADVAIPHDAHLSAVHFALQTDYAACSVRDLGSTNGTFVNGRRLKPQETSDLRDGDEILAGQTVFRVRISIEGSEGPPPTRSTLPATEASRPSAPSVSAYVAPRPLGITRRYSVETCDSGLVLCRGSVEEMPPADLAVALCSILPIYVLVDFRKLGGELPPELAAPNYLFDWFDPAVARTVSPVIIAQDDLLAWPSLLEQGWGNDAVIGFFSRMEKAAMLEHLRRALHKGQPGSPTDAIVGYCWPSVLGPLLAYSKAAFLEELLRGIDAVLAELPDLPDTWQVYGNAEAPKLLDQIGLKRIAPEEVPSSGGPPSH